MGRQQVIKRLRYLRNWEFLNIWLLPAYLIFVLRSREVTNWWPYAIAMAIVCFILLQGTLYWHLKLSAVRHKQRSLPTYFVTLFSTFKRANVSLLLFYLTLMVYWFITGSIAAGTLIACGLLFLFAVLEQINYYQIQLMHDNLDDIRYLLKHKRLRRSPLAVDLDKDNATNLPGVNEYDRSG